MNFIIVLVKTAFPFILICTICFWIGVLLFVCGCASPVATTTTTTTLQTNKITLIQSRESIIQLIIWHLHWNPGDYTNFVALTSYDLISWQVLAETQNTNIDFVPVDKQFFMLYGTNFETGDSDWATK